MSNQLYRAAKSTRFTVFACLTLAGVINGGCAPTEKADTTAKQTVIAPSATELAAYAGSHTFPTTRPSDELRVAALVSSDRGSIHIYNFSNAPLPEVDVWVNGAWVQHVRGISGNGHVIIRTAELYNSFGKNFAGQAEPVTRVQFVVGDKFFNAMGPVTQ